MAGPFDHLLALIPRDPNAEVRRYLESLYPSIGGGSGGGITRVITSIAINTVGASAANTDYIYIVSGATTFTLPTAVGNTNPYSVINSGVDVVTVDTTGAETINGDASVTLPVPNMALDFISDGANWRIK